MRQYEPTDDRPFQEPSRYQQVDLYEVAFVTNEGISQLAVVTFNQNAGSEKAAADPVANQAAEVQQVNYTGRFVLDSPEYHTAIHRADTVIERHDRGGAPYRREPPISWYQ